MWSCWFVFVVAIADVHVRIDCWLLMLMSQLVLVLILMLVLIFSMILRGKSDDLGPLYLCQCYFSRSQKEREICLSSISKWNRKIFFYFHEILVENKYKRKTFLHLLRGGGAFLYPLMNTEDGGFLKTAKWLKTLLSTNLPSYIWLFLLESIFLLFTKLCSGFSQNTSYDKSNTRLVADSAQTEYCITFHCPCVRHRRDISHFSHM